MKRTLLVLPSLAIVVVAGACNVGADNKTAARAFNVVEATIPDMQKAMAEKRLTSRELVTQYLIRIAMYEDRVNAALYVNPHALEEADALDRERAQGRVRGPLHGIPVALKDNIHTTHLPTTGGALAFAGYTPPYEATLTKNLRDAGAIIIAKTGLTELANWVAGNPNAMPGNYNASVVSPSIPTILVRIHATHPATAGRSSRQADRARASAPPRICGPPTSAATPADRS